MTHIYRVAAFIHRRDLRIPDNTGLLQALRLSRQVLPIFIFDPRQIEFHPYQSQPGLVFLQQAVGELRQAYRKLGAELALYASLPTEVLAELVDRLRIEAVYVNRDYTPFSRLRDDALAHVCESLGIDFISCPDCLITEPENMLKADGEPYRVFTPFWKAAKQQPVPLPEGLPEQPQFLRDDRSGLDEAAAFTIPDIPALAVTGGRQVALDSLGGLSALVEYEGIRDFPAVEGTSLLSAHLKFGTCSVREAYHAIIRELGADHPLLRQLYWRDFFTHIAFHFPHVFGKPFLKQYENLSWDNNPGYFQRWADGNTGFPIVDAGMRELNATGFMHNRVRMITASFLTKDLHISWRWGERYFARHLVDYDPAVNNGNWQWAASTGCDAQPYFRIFNPWLQQQKFDPECRYIKHWLPELVRFSPDILHNWHSRHEPCAYPSPMLEHAKESLRAKDAYRAAAAGVKS